MSDIISRVSISKIRKSFAEEDYGENTFLAVEVRLPNGIKKTKKMKLNDLARSSDVDEVIEAIQSSIQSLSSDVLDLKNTKTNNDVITGVIVGDTTTMDISEGEIVLHPVDGENVLFVAGSDIPANTPWDEDDWQQFSINDYLMLLRQSVINLQDNKVSEAPNDGKQYVRKNKSWVEIEDDFALINADEIFSSQRMSDSKYDLINQTINENKGLALTANRGNDPKIVFSISSIGDSGIKFSSVNEESVIVATISKTSIGGFHSIDVSSIPVSGGGSTYSSGDGINIDGTNKINVRTGNGLKIDAEQKLQVKLGKGLKFNTEAGVEGEVSIDDIGQEVIEEVNELSSELDKKITTTFNYAQITSAEDFAPYGVSGTTRMIGQLFAVPISSEIRENDTLICIRAKQGYAGKVSFGIFEFDFDGNEGTGSTTWLCDTGVVTIKGGENQFLLKNIIPTSTVRPVIKMEPGKLYYATVMIANDAPATGLFLASCPPYDQNYNATPKYTMVVSNMGSYVDWTNGSQRNTWFQGYNEVNNVPRLFMMIRNGEAAPVPTIDPFANYSSFTLEHRYRINDLFSLEFNVNNQPVLYQKIRPAQDCTIEKIGWVDYHSGATYDYATDIPLMLDGNSSPMTTFGDNVESSSGTKIDNVHYYHEFTLSTPINLQANTNYFVPCNMKISGADSEWVITYSSPSGTSKDLLLFDSKYNVASWAGDHAQYLPSQPGTLCRIVTSDGKTYTF